MKRYERLLIDTWLVISIIIGFVGCNQRLDQLFRPEPISQTNQPRYFHVIGFDKKNEPLIMVHEISALVTDNKRNYSTKAEFESSMASYCVFWNRDNHAGGPYTFYVPQSKTGAIENNARGAIDRKNFEAFEIEISKDNPKTHSQIVQVNFTSDDFSYYSIYEVKDGKIHPLKYGDALKADGVAAASTGIGLSFRLFIVGWLIVKLWCFIDTKRADKPNPGDEAQ